MKKAVIPLTWLLGILLTVLGLLGFIMGDPVIWFQVGTVHNSIHLIAGIIAFLCAGMGQEASKWYLIIFGLVAGLTTLLGFFNEGNVLGIIQVNPADNYLNLGLTVATLFIGFGSGSSEE